MAVFNVELKKIVDDSYEIEIGYDLMDKLVEDLKSGLVGKITKYAIITDSIVENLYADRLHDKLTKAGYGVEVFVFPEGEVIFPSIIIAFLAWLATLIFVKKDKEYIRKPINIITIILLYYSNRRRCCN